MSEAIPSPTEKSSNRTNKLLIVIIIILSLAFSFTLWQYFELRKTTAQKGTEIEFLNDERGELQENLEDMLSELDTLETDNDSMRVELSTKKAEIEGLLAKVKDKDYSIYKLKKETKTLRVIMRGYVVTIDSINTLNVGLRNENTKVRKTLSQERSKANELKKTNENLESKVALASRLDVSEINVFGVNVKRDLTGKETDRARKADKLRVCFILNENRVAKVGKKDLYLRIIAPDGVILTDNDSQESRFEYNGGKGYYSDKLTVNYDRAAKEYCLDWAKPDEDYDMPAGKYHLFLYAEDYEMAAVSYELK